MTKITIYMDAQDLPADVHGAITKDDTGTYYVLLNTNDSSDRRQQAFLHEMLHIYRGDLNKDGADVSELEGAAHAETPALLRN